MKSGGGVGRGAREQRIGVLVLCVSFSKTLKLESSSTLQWCTIRRMWPSGCESVLALRNTMACVQSASMAVAGPLGHPYVDQSRVSFCGSNVDAPVLSSIRGVARLHYHRRSAECRGATVVAVVQHSRLATYKTDV